MYGDHPAGGPLPDSGSQTAQKLQDDEVEGFTEKEKEIKKARLDKGGPFAYNVGR